MTINSQSFTLKQMLDKYWEYMIACIDIRQARTLARQKIYEALQHFQIPSKMIILVRVIMDDMVAKVQVQTEMMDLFEIRDGHHHCHSFS